MENVLEKKAFPDYKNNKLKKSKNCDLFNIGKKAKKMIFLKGLVHGFDQKLANFSMFLIHSFVSRILKKNDLLSQDFPKKLL